MESLFSVFILIIGIVASIASSAKKAKARKAAEEPHWPATPAASAPAAKKEPHPYVPMQTIMPPLSFSDAPGQRIAPTVHAHVQPDCETHDVAGSLGVVSTEGKDPCHEDQLSNVRIFTESEQEEGSLTFDWSGENMVKAFVMQEVLTRPYQRRAR